MPKKKILFNAIHEDLSISRFSLGHKTSKTGKWYLLKIHTRYIFSDVGLPTPQEKISLIYET